MDITNVAQLVTTVGFPIVASGALFWYIVKMEANLTDTINNNTIALTKLCEKIDSNN